MVVDNVRFVLKDMGLPSSSQYKQDHVLLMDLQSFVKIRRTLNSDNIVFLIEVEAIKADKKGESLLQEIVTTTSEISMYYTSSRSYTF